VLRQVTILFLVLCGNQTVSAQVTKIRRGEQELIGIYQQLLDSRFGAYDSLDYYNSLFTEKMLTLLSNEKTLSYSFIQLKKGAFCSISTSKDGLFRIYSWDAQLGGTMHFFNVIYQYKSGNTTKTQLFQPQDDGDPAWFCSDIFTLKAKTNTYYLGITNGVYSSKDVSQSIKAFEVTEKGLNDSIALMKTPEGLKNSLSIYFDFFTLSQYRETPHGVLNYDPKKKSITIACDQEESETPVKDCYYLYQFNGTFFELKTDQTKKM